LVRLSGRPAVVFYSLVRRALFRRLFTDVKLFTAQEHVLKRSKRCEADEID
jgi:hypothetical protein